MNHYSPDVKEQLVKRMMPPENASLSTLARETGISFETLRQWRKQARIETGSPVPGNGRRPQSWSPGDKLLAVLATAGMNETEQAEYCRSKGLYVEEIRSWREACLDGLAAGRDRDNVRELREELTSHRGRLKELERELRRKEKALAETAALLTLRKKAQAIWGDDEDGI